VKPLTVWVLREALRQHTIWREMGIFIRVAVNVSARTLHDPELVETVTQLLQSFQVEPSSLEVEITESAIMVDGSRHADLDAAPQRRGVDLNRRLWYRLFLAGLPEDLASGRNQDRPIICDGHGRQSR
jgi:EAL domain-containing protein (putative c-di-GMP-specific phosphodiesterase class I)